MPPRVVALEVAEALGEQLGLAAAADHEGAPALPAHRAMHERREHAQPAQRPHHEHQRERRHHDEARLLHAGRLEQVDDQRREQEGVAAALHQRPDVQRSRDERLRLVEPERDERDQRRDDHDEDRPVETRSAPWRRGRRAPRSAAGRRSRRRRAPRPGRRRDTRRRSARARSPLYPTASASFSTTYSCWSAVISGNIGSERMRPARRSATGKSPRPYPSDAYAGCRCSGTG